MRESHVCRVVGGAGFPSDLIVDECSVADERDEVMFILVEPVRREVHLLRSGQMHESDLAQRERTQLGVPGAP